MRLAAKILVTVGAVGLMIFFYSGTRFVYIDVSRQSRFIRTYNPTLGIEHFGRVLESSSSADNAAGRRGVWNSRDIRIRVAVEDTYVLALVNAIQRNVRSTLVRVGSRYDGGSSPSPNGHIDQTTLRSRYEESNATGVIRVGPAYHDSLRSDVSSTFIVPIWIEEQWLPK